jgi:hypothetical protein
VTGEQGQEKARGSANAGEHRNNSTAMSRPEFSRVLLPRLVAIGSQEPQRGAAAQGEQFDAECDREEQALLRTGHAAQLQNVSTIRQSIRAVICRTAKAQAR